MIPLLLLACVGPIHPDGWAVIREGCPSPVSGVVWTVEGDAARAGRLAEAEAVVAACDEDAARWDVLAEEASSALRACRVELDEARVELAEEPVEARGSGWAWTAAALAAPWVGWAACEAAGVDGSTWCGVGAGGALLGLSLAVSW